MLIEEILYNHIDTTLEVKLKPIFEASRRIKESYDENVRTRENTIYNLTDKFERGNWGTI